MGSGRRRTDGLKAFRDILHLAITPLLRVLACAGVAYGLLFILLNYLTVCRIPAGSIELAMARVQLERFHDALERYRLDCGHYPDSKTGLAALVSNPGEAGWKGPYIHGSLRDPWKRPFLYDLSPGMAAVRSLGADGKTGGDLFDSDLSSLAPWAPIQETAFHRTRDYFSLQIQPWLWPAISTYVLLRTRPRARTLALD